VIVVGTDGSSGAALALDAALALADEGEPMLLVTAWHELRGDFGLPYDRLVHPDSAEIEREWAERTSAAAAEQAKAAGHPAEAVVRHEKPTKALCAVAGEREARMLVVGSAGWGAVEGMLVGSVSAGVLHSAPCTVVVVRPPRGQVGAPAGDPAAV
jgi:nucleotide-binding universal stress UspA family protein